MQPLLAAQDVTVDFGHIRALNGASLQIYPGETLALVGDNGAGKTTLVRVLGGELSPDRGIVVHRGETVVFNNVREAQRLGIHIVHQDLALCPDLSAVENLILGHEPVRPGVAGKLGFLDRKVGAAEAERRLSLLQIHLPNINATVRTLSGGQRQSLAVARGLAYGHGTMLMDEPTAALGNEQTAMVYRAIERAAASGIAVVVVSHDLTQVLDFADQIAVMRHGRVVTVEPASSMSIRGMIDIMMGASVPTAEEQRPAAGDDIPDQVDG